MKKLFFSTFFFLVLLFGCNLNNSKKDNHRIAIVGLGIESSTFSPATTDEEAFRAKYGKDIFDKYSFLAPDSTIRKSADWIPLIVGKALPGGIKEPRGPS